MISLGYDAYIIVTTKHKHKLIGHFETKAQAEKALDVYLKECPHIKGGGIVRCNGLTKTEIFI